VIGDRVREIIYFFEQFYRLQGFQISIPPPYIRRGDEFVALNDDMLLKGLYQRRALFYRPPSHEVPFDEMMKSLYGPRGWVIDTDDKRRLETTWEHADTGYWFWVDMTYSPRGMKKESEIHREEAMTLMSIEEYLIVFSALIGSVPQADDETFSWLPIPIWLRTQSSGRHLAASNGYRFMVDDNRDAYARPAYRLV